MMPERPLLAPLLAVDGLRKLYPIRKQRIWQRGAAPSFLHAVDGVSFTIGQGETVGLVGESGCGKSTVIRLIARLIDASAGSICFDGEQIDKVPARKFGLAPKRAQIQMVFQDATDSLNPRFTASRAIADPLLRLRRSSGTALRTRVEEVARLTGLPQELLGRFPHQLSGGQKARVGIARAIAVEPRLLLLDEPTSALDVSVQVVILRLLRDLKRQLGLSYLFVSHDLNVVRLLCSHILVMYLGRIVESGPAAQVFAAPAHPYTPGFGGRRCRNWAPAAGGRCGSACQASHAARSTRRRTSARFTADVDGRAKNARRPCLNCERLRPNSSPLVITRIIDPAAQAKVSGQSIG